MSSRHTFQPGESGSYHRDFMLDLSKLDSNPLIRVELTIRKLLLDRGITNSLQLSKLSGVSQPACWHWWRWKRPLNPRDFAKVLHLLGLSLAVMPTETLPKTLPLGTEELILAFARGRNER